MSDVNISKYRAQVIRQGSTPASPGFAVAEGQNPVDPSGSGQTHLPVTIATATTGLSITESQILSGAGLVSQYIRGDGSLADFPASTGGGSSVSYYLNGSVSQGTIGGVAYKQLNRTPVFGAGTDFTINANGYIASFITDASDPNKLLIPAGNWNFETYFSASSNGGSPSFYVELYKYDGTTFTLIATSSSAPELIAFGTSLNPYYSTLAVPQTTLALTDRLAIRYYVTHSGRTITLHTEDNHLCQIITTFTTGLTALNGLTAQVQNFAVGTSGTDFAISSATATHTFNLPTASASNRGALSSADWTTFNNKTSNLGTVTSVGLSSATSGVTIGSSPVTTSGTITLAIATASGSQNGLLSSTDWTTFNGKQNALTNPVTGTGTTNYLPKFTGSTTIGNSQIFDNGTNVGIGTALPDSKLTVNGQVKVSDLTLQGFYQARTSDTPSAGVFGGNSFVLRNGATSEDLNFDVFNRSTSVWYTPVTIKNTGNLLVGTTTDAGYKLDVNGTGRFSGLLTISGVANNNFQSNRSGTSAQFQTWYESNGTTRRGYFGYPNGASDNFTLMNEANGQMAFGTNSSTALTLASTGAATFSSDIQGGGDLYFNRAIRTTIYPTTTNQNLHMKSNGSGVLQFNNDNTGNLTMCVGGGNVLIGTTTDNGDKLQVNGAIKASNLLGATYTPTASNTGNLSAVSPQVCQYIRIDNIVNVSGVINITPITSGAVFFDISLPISNGNFTSFTQTGGNGVTNVVYNSYTINSNSGTTRVSFNGVSTYPAIHSLYFSFQYIIL